MPFFSFLDDSHALWQYSLARKSYAFAVRGEYQLALGHRHNIQTDISYFYGAYYGTYRVPVGGVHSRTIGLMGISYSYTFLRSSRWAFSICAGAKGRWGEEDVVLSYPRYFEVNTRPHLLRDLGFDIGPEIAFHLHGRLGLLLAGEYSRFVVRYDHGAPPNGWHDGSSQNQLSCSIGLSLGLGKAALQGRTSQSPSGS